MTFAVRHDEPLAPRTTLLLGGSARLFVEASERAQILDALRWARDRGEKVGLLGGGSNLVVSDAGFEGLVIHLSTRGLQAEAHADFTTLTVQAGEPWQDVVDHAIDLGLCGLECLTGIPGRTGATPIQNVGAYGQEVSDTIDAVEVFDRQRQTIAWLSNKECGFGYRTSRLKREPERWVVLAVRFRLPRGAAPSVRYPELQQALAVHEAEPTLRQVADAVYALRAQKSMVLDPNDDNRHSAGSFFTNPVVSAREAEALASRCMAQGIIGHPDEMPRFVSGHDVKLSAGWLIEHAGFAKGLRRGAVGISSRHALSLVHYGGGRTEELLALASEIERGVQSQLGVVLAREPVCW